ncbi:uncharacterized protein LOC106642561 [Copidosoma floridanum]|uniref:uncharacterized protein LOC106642561 n=1 Tax=Copidosoma floridanum TaxID=29053 RepID=UPI0006C9DFCE|nr:uncharacterized protein LOC106642561 [Copidosoma floridanum]
MISMSRIVVLCVAVVALAAAQPAKNEFWKGTSMDAMVEQTKLECAQSNDEISCMKFKVLNLLDHLFRKDSFKVSETVEVTRNSYPVDELSGRSLGGEGSLLETVRGYLTSHDVTFKLPFESSIKVSSRNIDDDELSFSFKYGEGRNVEARKSKLKKVIIPILVFVLLKAMTLIPLAIGVLGLKAWNALQLSFFSFVVSVGLAIFQLCKKIAADSHAAPIAAHGPWEYQAAQYRSFQEAPESATAAVAAQNLAYSAYAEA